MIDAEREDEDSSGTAQLQSLPYVDNPLPLGFSGSLSFAPLFFTYRLLSRAHCLRSS